MGQRYRQSPQVTPDSKVETLVNATREQVRTALNDIARTAKPDDAFVLMLIGHGSFDGSDYKFNLPGPDLPARTGRAAGPHSRHAPVSRQHDQLQRRLDRSRCARPNRVVITATKSGTEKNATVFARYWVEALRDPAADTR